MRIDAIVVVVPIRNEQELLGRCLAALSTSIESLATAAPTGPRVLVTLVLDACTDASARIAHASPFEAISVAFGNVGLARSYGIQHALRRVGERDLSRVWIANTDADSAVPATWLRCQLRLAVSGIGVMVGSVRPDPADLDPAQLAAWKSTEGASTDGAGAVGARTSTMRVYGANLGFRAELYRAVGGFRPVAEHEDVLIVERLRGHGAVMAATSQCEVLTSAREIGRTPAGFARYIREELSATGR